MHISLIVPSVNSLSVLESHFLTNLLTSTPFCSPLKLFCIFSLSIESQSQSFSQCLLLSLRKGVREGEVTSEDREHAKRIVYSVVYGAGEYKHTQAYSQSSGW